MPKKENPAHEAASQYLTMLVIPGLRRLIDIMDLGDYYHVLDEFQLFWPIVKWSDEDEHVKAFLKEIQDVRTRILATEGVDPESRILNANIMSQAETRDLAMRLYQYTWKRLHASEMFKMVYGAIALSGEKISGKEARPAIPSILSSRVE